MKLRRIQWSNRIFGPESEQERTLSEFLDDYQGPQGAKVAFISDEEDDLIGGAARLFTSLTPGMVLPASRLNGGIRQLILSAGFTFEAPASAQGPTRGSGDPETEISVLTSGTTGAAKLITHRWRTLVTASEEHGREPRRWLSTYEPGSYAWFQMVQLLLFVPGQDLILPPRRDVASMLEAGLEYETDSISATPTFWRMALLQFTRDELRHLQLKTITLGGEVVDQELLDQLRDTFVDATVTHIYASTEHGATIVVNDGLAGFPAEWVGRSHPGRPEYRIESGTLRVRTPFSALGEAEWHDTGDAVEERQGRVYILGRASSAFINVGGSKVPAQRVTEVLLSHPAISWCRVYGKAAPLVGELVAADWVGRSGERSPSEADLAVFCRERLDESMVPRVWRRLDSIPASESLKAASPNA